MARGRPGPLGSLSFASATANGATDVRPASEPCRGYFRAKPRLDSGPGVGPPGVPDHRAFQPGPKHMLRTRAELSQSRAKLGGHRPSMTLILARMAKRRLSSPQPRLGIGRTSDDVGRILPELIRLVVKLRPGLSRTSEAQNLGAQPRTHRRGRAGRWGGVLCLAAGLAQPGQGHRGEEEEAMVGRLQAPAVGEVRSTKFAVVSIHVRRGSTTFGLGVKVGRCIVPVGRCVAGSFAPAHCILD